MYPRFSIAILISALLATPASAYIGPGAGIGVIGTALALLGAVVLLIAGFIWYPIKRYLHRNRPADKTGAEDQK